MSINKEAYEKYLSECGREPDAPAGSKFPLVTYNLPPDAERGHYTHINGLYVFVRGRLIPTDQLDSLVLDLGDGGDRDKLSSGAWKENWNGVWVIYTAMDGNKAVIGGEKIEGEDFIGEYAEPVVTDTGFRYCVVIGDKAGDSSGGVSFAFDLSEGAGAYFVGDDSFYGCKGEINLGSIKKLFTDDGKPTAPKGGVSH